MAAAAAKYSTAAMAVLAAALVQKAEAVTQGKLVAAVATALTVWGTTAVMEASMAALAAALIVHLPKAKMASRLLSHLGCCYSEIISKTPAVVAAVPWLRVAAAAPLPLAARVTAAAAVAAAFWEKAAMACSAMVAVAAAWGMAATL